MAGRDPEDVEKDKIEKQELVRRLVEEACVPSSSIAEFAHLAKAFTSGEHPLDIEVLTGGLTNYSYRLSLRSTWLPGKTHLLFAKLSFPYALWNPENCHYDTKRTENEALIMSRFSEVAPGTVPKPLLCEDVEGGMKLLVVQWAEEDEQLSNQFIDGRADTRVASGLAKTVAKLHKMPCDPSFNEDVKGTMISFIIRMQGNIEKLPSKTNRTGDLAKSMGNDKLAELGAAICAAYETQHCLVHSDVHGFNVLVEPKPSIERLQDFGEKGTFKLVDWEMAYVGPVGRDIGIMMAFPIACALSHAISGAEDCAKDVLSFIDTFWVSYKLALCSDEDDNGLPGLPDIYRGACIWLSSFLLFYHIEEIHLEFLPLKKGTKDYDAVRDSLGVLGLRLLSVGCCPSFDNTSLANLEKMYESAISQQLEAMRIAKLKTPSRARRSSSVLREQGRRISDGDMIFRMSMTGLAIDEADEED